ncbi:16S rRNA (uracil(1498)-N(3))-methyltransferase [Geovibrio thiophilus]|uniref:Ribosomal RNA small subunit methyltransferase E n=1 Tax=Geovibrio thiophilus TaxID=139438 RepID=A0A3R5XX46_9BACT|nr:RsmE family RNA methyltransferase [Geovibrio thiophilus]QAR33365.1 16S rRNA (uracil(1498)-N(3))-methyltransferase [Geovibrio thiophilus]
MKRIWLDEVSGSSCELRDDAHHYVKTVLRSREGDIFGILTPEKFCTAKITQITNKFTVLEIVEECPVKKPDYRLSVYQCVLKREYMDFAVEKYAELGVTEITPVISARSMKDVKDKSFNRYHDIAVKAVLQSENQHVPIINPPVELADITADHEEKLFFYERKEGKEPVKLKGKNAAIIIGCEGGFEEEEAEILKSKGFRVVSPFKPVLKAETAAVVFTGLVRMELE